MGGPALLVWCNIQYGRMPPAHTHELLAQPYCGYFFGYVFARVNIPPNTVLIPPRCPVLSLLRFLAETKRLSVVSCSVAPTRDAVRFFVCPGWGGRVYMNVAHTHTHTPQGAALLYNNFMKDFLAKSNGVNPIPGETKVEVRGYRKSCARDACLLACF